MIRGYLHNQNPHESFSLFVQMRFQEGIFIDSFSISIVLKACVRSIDHLNGAAIHTQVLKLGFTSDLFVQTAIVEMYGKFGCVEISGKFFDEISNQM